MELNKEYKPMFLSWAKSYEHEVSEFKRLIENGCPDEKALRHEYQELTGKRYYSVRQ